MIIDLGKPSAKQKEFFRARAKNVGYGGARGGGKSWAARTKAVLLASHYPGIRILTVRQTYPEIINNHIRPLQGLLNGYAKYNDRDKTFTFPNGSIMQYTYCGGDADLSHVQGNEWDVIFFEEATNLSEYQIKAIRACNRGTGNFPRRCYYTTNPGGQSHAYFKRIFVDRRFEAGEDPADYEFIQALVTDNAALMESDPEYIKTLESLPHALREAWLHGRWDVYEGQYFESFRDLPDHYDDRIGTHVINPFQPPLSWPIYRSFDWGYSKPFSTGWWTVDGDGRLYRILEYYGCTDEPNTGLKMSADAVFANIHKIEQEHPYLAGRDIIGVADPAIWSADGGESIAETASKHQVFFNKGDHQRIPGWMQMQYRLKFDSEGIPMMYVFKGCKAFIRTIPTLMYDEHKPEDLDTDGEDHCADECRYMCMMRPIKPTSPPEPMSEADAVIMRVFDIEPGTAGRRTARPKMEIIRE